MANSQTIVVVVDFERDVAITAAPGDVLSYRDCLRFAKSEFFNDDGTQKIAAAVISAAIQDRVVTFRQAIRDSRNNPPAPLTLRQRYNWDQLSVAEKQAIKTLLTEDGL